MNGGVEVAVVADIGLNVYFNDSEGVYSDVDAGCGQEGDPEAGHWYYLMDF